MATMNQLSYLRKSIYLECRNIVLTNGGNDDVEYIKSIRDEVIYHLFPNKTKDTLNFTEMNAVLKYLKGKPAADTPGTITHNQLKNIKYYGISIGLFYCDFVSIEIKINGKPGRKEEAKKELQRLFNNGKAIPQVVIKYLYENWINPVCNRWLVEGGYRKSCKNPKMLYYERLTKSEAQYIIQRFSQTWNEVNKKDAQSHIYDARAN